MRKVCLFLSLLVILSVSIQCKKETSNDSTKYLTSNYASNTRRHYDALSRDKQTYLKNKAEASANTAFTLYKNKKFHEAKTYFEKALNYYVDSKMYYTYGNVLYNLKQYKSAIKAWEISNKLLKKEKLEKLIYYNIACAYSQIGDFEQSIENLKHAFDNGYYSIKHVISDPDLKALRESPKGKTLFKKLAAIINVNPKCKNIHKYEAPEINHDYYFFSDNTVYYKKIYSTNKRHGRIERLGKWKQIGYYVHIKWKKEIRYKGVGRIVNRATGIGHIYEKYKKTLREINQSERINFREYLIEEIMSIVPPGIEKVEVVNMTTNQCEEVLRNEFHARFE